MKYGKIQGSTYELIVSATALINAYKAVTVIDGDTATEVVKIGVANGTTRIIGITTYNLSGQGFITIKGIVKNIPGLDTTISSMGATVYATTTGDLTLTTTDRIIGYVISLNGNGSIFVDPQYVPNSNQNFQYLPLNVSTNGQTTFNMGITIPTPANTIFMVNGGKQEYTYDYTITGTNLTWLNTNFTLATSDRIELYY